MGCRLTYGTAGATGGGFSSQPGTLQPAYSDDRAEPRWSWQQRSPKTWKDRQRWDSLWSWGCRVGGGDLEGYAAAAFGGLASKDLYEPYSCDGAGTQSIRFIRGICKDSTGTTPIANATVQCFRTSDDAFGGEAVSRDDGSYEVPTPFVGVAHYVVAYKVGSPDIAGTTVNTLIPE